jgi:spore germination cell wall hydrolase CwlJ-like protein
MIFKFRAAAIAAAVFTIATTAAAGVPALARQSQVTLPSLSFLDHAPASLGARFPSFGDALFAAPTSAPPLDVLVANQAAVETNGAEQECLANAVYFEARGESLQGQLAVAEVVMNRAASGRYPTTLCGVVVQPSQFSFVRRGRMPRPDRDSEAWRRAVGVARVAFARMAPRLLPATCLWYHANYVSPSWGRRLERSAQIGLHIFYS